MAVSGATGAARLATKPISASGGVNPRSGMRRVGADLTGATTRRASTVVDALRGAGYRVELLDALERPADDPDDIDYEKLKTDAEMILQLRVDEVGMYSSKLSPDYLPRVNVQAKLYVKSRDDSIYDESLYFGVDAKPGKEFTIVSDPKFAYPSFDAVIARSDEIAGLFESGTDALARMLTAQLLDVLATKTRPAP